MNIDALLTLGVVFFMLYASVFFLIIFAERRSVIKKDPFPKNRHFVSIIIPAYQGDRPELIEKAVNSALALSYPEKEVVISWNGPKNSVFDFCKKFDGENVAVISTETPGKAAGMNNALKSIKGEYFCCLDADSFFTQTDFLDSMVGYLEEPNVVAVTSAMKVSEPKTIMQKIQWVEYVFAIYLRKMMSFINCLYVAPGPGSVYKTEVVKNVGGFDEHNLTEDMEIAFRLQKHGYQIRNSTNAFVETVAPEKLTELVKQRVRWYAGFVDNIKKYKFFVLNPKYGSLGMYILPSSMLWILVLFYTVGKLIFNTADGVNYAFRTLLLTGFHPDMLWHRFLDSIYFQPTFMTLFILVFFMIGITAIVLSLWTANEKLNLRKKYLDYTLYFGVYTFLMVLFWVASLFYVVSRNFAKTKIKW